MKSMNRKESKKIAVIAALIMGFMVIAFMPLAAAKVTSFTVTPSSGVVGAVDSYDALVTTTGVTTINITIPAGFLAVVPATGGVQIARLDFWNSSTKAYYGFATITANDTKPTTHVDLHCEIGGATATTTQKVNYAPGGITTFVSNVGDDTSSVIIKLPTKTENGSIKIRITYAAFYLDDLMVAIGQFVRNPTTAGDYDFIADGVKETVSITALKGCGAVFRNGWWYADLNGDHTTDVYLLYGVPGDEPVVGDIDNNGTVDSVIYRQTTGYWYVPNEDHTGTDWTNSFWYGGRAGDIPLLGDIDNNGVVDAVFYRPSTGYWYVANESHDGTTDWSKSFWYGCFGLAGDIPLLGDIDNNGVVDLVIYNQASGWWYVANENHDGTIDMAKSFLWGHSAGGLPIIDDIRGDGASDAAVLKNDGMWLVSKRGHTGTDYGFMYGIPGDVPVLHVFA